MRIKLLVISEGFPPAKTYGGPATSLFNFCNILNNDLDIFVVAANHELKDCKPLEGVTCGWNHKRGYEVCYLDNRDANIRRFNKIFIEIKPDAIYINSLFDARFAVPFLAIAKKYNCPVLLAPRGQLCVGAFKKKYKKIPYLFFLKICGCLDRVSYHSTSCEETESIKKRLKCKDDLIFEMSNFPSVISDNGCGNVKEKGKLRIIYLARIHPQKSTLFAVSVVEKLMGDIEFDIYGPIEDKEYWEKCKRIICDYPQRIKVKYCGVLNHNDVYETLSKYDLFLLPTCNENFGHSIVEAMMAGTPVVISDQTPWHDLDKYGVGWDISLNEKERYIEKMQSMVEKDNKEYEHIRNRVKKYINNRIKIDSLKLEYLNCLNKIIDFR